MMARFVWIAGLGLLGLLAGCQQTHSTTAPSDAPDPVILARYQGGHITLDEFERRYAASVGDETNPADDSLAAYRDFLDRLVNFKLKVKAAREAGMDQDEDFLNEVRNYRLQMARPRLMKREIMDPIIDTLYARRQHEVAASHILIQVAPDAPPADTMDAYTRLASIVDSLDRGADFGTMAERHSEDPSAQREGAPGYRGDLGYLTAGRTVKPFEDQMYRTPVGDRSPIFRTRYGYHVLRVNDIRPRRPAIDVAHIMISPASGSPADTAAARDLATALRDSLQQGVPFEALARRHSDDPRSAQNGGMLGTIRSDQQLPPAFKEAAFALDDVGAVSDVVRTRFGYHLIKLVDRATLPSYEEAYDDLREMAGRLPRTEAAQRAFASSRWPDYNLRVDTSAVLQAAYASSLNAPAQALAPSRIESTLLDRTVASLGDSTYTLRALSASVEAASSEQQPSGTQSSSTLGEALDSFLTDATLDYEAATLERRDPAFRRQMQEYREGLLLFQFMQDSVWTAATRDTEALRAYYETHREQYQYPERARVITLGTTSEPILRAWKDTLRAAPAVDRVLQRARSSRTVQMDTVEVPLTAQADTASVYRNALTVDAGGVAGPVATADRSLLLVRRETLPARPMTFDEARSTVLQDYQNAVEARTHERLRARYQVDVFPDRLAAAFEPDRHASTP